MNNIHKCLIDIICKNEKQAHLKQKNYNSKNITIKILSVLIKISLNFDSIFNILINKYE